MKCPVLIANELSGIDGMGYKEASENWRFADGNVFRYRSEAGNENSRDYFTGNE